MKLRGSTFRPVLTLIAVLTVAIFGAGLTGCGQTPERCGSEAGGGDCRDPSDFTTLLSGSLVLEVDGWPEASKVSGRDGSGSRWEYFVTVDEALYRNATVDDVVVGSTTLVAPLSAVGGSPSWNTKAAGPVYVVADRATGSSGPVDAGDLVVKGVFDQNLGVIGAPGKTTNLQAFIAWLEAGGKHYDPASVFLVDWVRSLNEEIRPDGGHPMQDVWLEYLSPGPDPERNLDPSTITSQVEPNGGTVEVDENPAVLTTPSPPPAAPGG